MRTPDYESLRLIRESQYAARDALIDELQKLPWDFFYTSTFKHQQNFPFTALERAATAAYSKWSGHRGFAVAERFKLGGWHVHGLVSYGSDIPEVLRVHATRELSRLGWCRMEPVASIGGVSAYVSKYLLKTQGEWQIYNSAQWVIDKRGIIS